MEHIIREILNRMKECIITNIPSLPSSDNRVSFSQEITVASFFYALHAPTNYRLRLPLQKRLLLCFFYHWNILPQLRT